MAGLQDFFSGMPLTNDALQALVQALENLQEKATRTIWVRRWDGSENRKDTADGDNVVVVAITRSTDASIGANETDRDIPINFPITFSKTPVVIASAISSKPLMVSVQNVDTEGAILSCRSVGSIENKIDIRGVSFIAIGPKAQSN